jgi:Lipase maturation factor
VISPSHYRLDWQLWFAAMSSIGREPWLVHLVAEVLAGDPGVKRLLAVDPLPAAPPRFVRILRYRYEFTRPGDGSRDWWRRTYVGEYLRPLALDDPELRRFLERAGWRQGSARVAPPRSRLRRALAPWAVARLARSKLGCCAPRYELGDANEPTRAGVPRSTSST